MPRMTFGWPLEASPKAAVHVGGYNRLQPVQFALSRGKVCVPRRAYARPRRAPGLCHPRRFPSPSIPQRPPTEPSTVRASFRARSLGPRRGQLPHETDCSQAGDSARIRPDVPFPPGNRPRATTIGRGAEGRLRRQRRRLRRQRRGAALCAEARFEARRAAADSAQSVVFPPSCPSRCPRGRTCSRSAGGGEGGWRRGGRGQGAEGRRDEEREARTDARRRDMGSPVAPLPGRVCGRAARPTPSHTPPASHVTRTCARLRVTVACACVLRPPSPPLRAAARRGMRRLSPIQVTGVHRTIVCSHAAQAASQGFGRTI